MKKVAFVLSLLFIGTALADSAPTSVGYVDSQIGALQNKISAVDTNTVLTTTNTAGEIGQKSIYDATGNYVEQQNALVTAEVANAAVQNAIDTEFVCTEWLDGAEHTNENCLIYTVRNPAPNRILPTGYTPLEYIESTGTQYIRTGHKIYKTDNARATLDMMVDNSDTYTYGGWSGADGFLQLNFVNAGYYRCKVNDNNLLHRVYFGNRDNIILTYENYITTLFANGIKIQDINWVNWNSSYNYYCILALCNTDATQLAGGLALPSKVYKATLTINGDLVGIYIPARRDSDGKIGMYDLVSNTFFTNSGTGEFIAGPELNVYLPNGQ